MTTLFATQPFEKVALNWVRTHGGAHARRYDEVKQVRGVLRELGVEPTITRATVAFFRRSAPACGASRRRAWTSADRRVDVRPPLQQRS